MPIHKAAFDPILALAALIRPGNEARVIPESTEGDSFVLLGQRRLVDPTYSLSCMFGARRNFGDLLSAAVKNVGDVMRIVRIDPRTVAVEFLTGREHEIELLNSHASYVRSISNPREFALAWNEFASLILSVVMMIGENIEDVLERRGECPLDTAMSDDSLAELMELMPHARALTKYFQGIRAFTTNPFMQERWELAFVRSQSHHMSNALQQMTVLEYFLQRNGCPYSEIVRIISGAYEVFDPIAYLDKAYVHGNVSAQWIAFNLEGRRTRGAIPEDAVHLRRVIDEIVYAAGAAANGAPQVMDVRLTEDALVFQNEAGAFDQFTAESLSRRLCERYCGQDRISFSGNTFFPVTTITIPLALRPVPLLMLPAMR